VVAMRGWDDVLTVRPTARRSSVRRRAR
jgi:hypothetical protein